MSDLQNVFQFSQQVSITDRAKNTGTTFVLTNKYILTLLKGVSAPEKVEFQSYLNLCLKTLSTMQKESAQSDHSAKRKRPKCGQILPFQVNVKISQYICMFYTFSLDRVVGFS